MPRHFDVVGPVLQRFLPVRKRHPPRDQPVEPSLVGAAERRQGALVMPAVGVDRTEYDVVVEHHRPVESSEIERRPRGDRRYPADKQFRWRRAAQNIGDQRWRPVHSITMSGASSMISRSCRSDKARRGRGPDPASAHRSRGEHVDLIVPLDAHHGREQPDRRGSGHRHAPRLPGVKTPADALDVVPCLGDHAGRL